MLAQDDDEDGRVVAIVLAFVILVAIAVALGVALSSSMPKSNKAAPSPVAAVAPAPPAAPAPTPAVVQAPVAPAPEAAPTAPATEMSADTASVEVDNGVVKFYFASGKSDLASGAGQALVDVVAAGKAGKKIVISGFHDTVGNPEKNAELAKKRAKAVKTALLEAGIPENLVELKKPEKTEVVGNNAQARRVEVKIAP